MSEMVQRGVAALYAYWRDHGYDPGDPDDGAVRAVITAMREPTNAMCHAADFIQVSRIAESGKGGWLNEDDAYDIWQVMIDEMLK